MRLSSCLCFLFFHQTHSSVCVPPLPKQKRRITVQRAQFWCARSLAYAVRACHSNTHTASRNRSSAMLLRRGGCCADAPAARARTEMHHTPHARVLRAAPCTPSMLGAPRRQAMASSFRPRAAKKGPQDFMMDELTKVCISLLSALALSRRWLGVSGLGFPSPTPKRRRRRPRAARPLPPLTHPPQNDTHAAKKCRS